jgi:iron complex transport system substrate-binding protein
MSRSDKIYRNGISSFILSAFIVTAFIMLPSCGKKSDTEKVNVTSAPLREITDMKGNSVKIPENVSRVAFLGGPSGQISYILGVQDRLCAVTKTLTSSELVGIFDPSMKSRPAVRTVSGMVNIEQLIETDPQLVIAGDLDGEIVQRKSSIPVAFFGDSMSIGVEDIKNEIRFYSSIFQTEERAKAYCDYLDSVAAMIRKRTGDIPGKNRKVIFNGYGTSHLVTLGNDTFMKERFEIAGCINAAETVSTAGKKEGLHSGLGEVSMEQLLQWNPDIIVLDTGRFEDLAKDSRWMSTKAVKNKQVFIQPAGVFIWDRPTAEAAVLHPLWLAMIAYPEKFKDISFTKEVQKFYREIFHFNLSAEQARKVETGYFKMKIMKGSN